MKNHVRTGTLFIAVAVAFGIGFLSGVLLTTYKSIPSAVDHAHGGSEEMIAALKQEVNQNPNNDRAWVQLGNIYFDSEKYEEAVKAYERAVALDPKNPDVWTDLGVMYRRIKKPDQAVAAFGKAIALEPGHKTARFNTGIVLLFDLNQREKAVEAWKALLEIDPLFATPAGQSLDELIEQYSAHSDGEELNTSK